MNTRLKIIKRIDELIKEDEEKGYIWSESAKKLAKSKAALNWAKSRCLGDEWRWIKEEEYDDATIECIARNAFVYARTFAKRWGMIQYKS